MLAPPFRAVALSLFLVGTHALTGCAHHSGSVVNPLRAPSPLGGEPGRSAYEQCLERTQDLPRREATRNAVYLVQWCASRDWDSYEIWLDDRLTATLEDTPSVADAEYSVTGLAPGKTYSIAVYGRKDGTRIQPPLRQVWVTAPGKTAASRARDS